MAARQTSTAPRVSAGGVIDGSVTHAGGVAADRASRATVSVRLTTRSARCCR